MTRSNSVLVITFLLMLSTIFCSAEPESNRFTNFYKVSPDTGEDLGIPTVAKWYHDDSYIYFEWEVEITENFSRGRKLSDQVFDRCDWLRIQLVTSPSDLYAYYFYAFPQGHKYDGIRESDMRTPNDWNSRYSYTNTITADSWHTVMKIPFRDLRYHGKAPYRWKVILTRYLHHEDEYYSSPYATISQRQEFFYNGHDIVINTPLPHNYNTTIRPYVLDNYNSLERELQFTEDNAGLDVSFQPNSYLNTKLSFNPDFSDVPMDTESDLSNLRYAPTFRENRYFFVEDLDVFNISTVSFYTKNIMQPQWTGKITGNDERLSYGLLVARDKEIVDDSGIVTNPDDLYSAVALNYKAGVFRLNNSVFYRRENDSDNIMIQTFPVVFTGRNSVLMVRNLLSHHSSGSETTSDYFVFAGYEHVLNDLELQIVAQNTGRNFVSRTGVLQQETGEAGYRVQATYIKENSGIFKRNESTLLFDQVFENSNYKFREHSFNIGNTATFKNDLQVGVNGGQYSIFDGEKRFYITNGSGSLSYTRRGVWGAGTDYYAADNYIWSLGRQELYQNFSGWAWSHLTERIYIYYEINYIWYDNITPEEQEYFDREFVIMNTDINYQFSQKMYLKGGFRYNNYSMRTYDYSGSYGLFLNYGWEFIDNYHLYLGYNTREQNFGGWEPLHRTFYCKFRADFSL